ncbi:tripartite tricarboxylate transporter substrate binding protein [Candidimonas humi]|uniref:Bug family tripartite tricarboxylate transporter substrate binding protein n=1 Tax=Candidimonas humi TaxID=683355 RepID=A0ABV8NV97_9BURK|nr:tripartite tricarboxylate transporter substrate binding protein [Candidimonas humi]MBV6303397.1 tripartite tricarboxylate transporter substrate binding protein [Candidimonas humi]
MKHMFIKAVMSACLLASGFVAAHAAASGSYPDRPIKIVVGFVPGGPTDLYARIAAHGLEQILGQQFVVENLAGASGAIAAATVAKSKPDGYTLLVNVVSDIITPLAKKNPGYNLEKNFSPIGLIADAPNVLVVNRGVPVDTLKGLIDYARRHPHTINYGSAGTGTVSHLAGALLASAAGIDITHVPYKGTNGAQMDLLAGRVSMMFDNLTNGLANAKAGKVKALAVTSPQRWPGAKDLPTMAELGFPGVTISSVFGLMAPAGTPKPVVEKLSRALAKVLQNKAYREKIVQSGAQPGALDAKEYGEYIAKESRRWKLFLQKHPGIIPAE